MTSNRLIRRCALIGVALLALGASAEAQVITPRVIPRRARVQKSSAVVFGELRDYFSKQFTLERANEMTGELIARGSAIDSGTWTQWAYCKVSPLDLLDNLQTDSVTITANVSADGPAASYVNVSADFHATYAIGTQSATVDCTSNGVLENEILDAVGARMN
jgi:hypothetical protein